MAGTLLVTALTAVAVGFAAAGHADDEAPNPGTDAAIVVPAPAAPALRWLKGFFDPHVHCDYRFDDRFPCDWR